jgi:hypothetical protein
MMTFARSMLAATVLIGPVGLLAAEGKLTEQYRDAAGRIVGTALQDVEGWKKLTYLTTEIGPRLSGSSGLERAIEWAHATMEEEGLENVRLQAVKVPHWVRGKESAEVLSPLEKPLGILGLGGSVGTPPGGITAPVIVVRSFDELEALGRERVEGKIVLYAVPWMSYPWNREYRGAGASRAAKLGAVAALIRSATDRSLYTPHTGGMRYEEGVPRIPATAITLEDMAWMQRTAKAGHEVVVKLYMEAKNLPEADSANVIAEIVGSEKPEEIVVMGGHYDSWDVGQGAHDDGAACIAAWQALKILKDLGLRPRRTLRVVLWTNEENGLAGGRAYREMVGDGIDNHVAAIEMDGGAERPIGFGFALEGVASGDMSNPTYEVAFEKLQEIGRLLDGIDAGEILRGGGGADIGPLMRDGVPGLAQRTVRERYRDWHHTHADTLDKVDPQDFRKAVAMLGVMGYVLADMPTRLIAQ